MHRIRFIRFMPTNLIADRYPTRHSPFVFSRSRSFAVLALPPFVHILSTWLNNCGGRTTSLVPRVLAFVPICLFRSTCSSSRSPLFPLILCLLRRLNFLLCSAAASWLNRFSESLSRQRYSPGVESHYVGALRVHSRLRSVTLSRRRLSTLRLLFRNRALSALGCISVWQLSRFAFHCVSFVHANVIDVPASWLGIRRITGTTVRSPVARTRALSSRSRRSMPDRPVLAAEVFRSPFVRAKEQREHRLRDETVSKAANTDREGGSIVLVAWLARRAALPRDTLLKQGTTLKFSEESGGGVL